MKKLIIALTLSAVLIGCDADDWLKVEKGAVKAGSLADSAEKVAVSTSFITGVYGQAAVPILGAIATIATAVAGLARSKTKKVAKAASQAAEETSGGGQELVNAAHEHGVSKEILKAYGG